MLVISISMEGKMYQFKSKEVEEFVMSFVNSVISDLDLNIVDSVYIDDCSSSDKIWIVFVLDVTWKDIPSSFLDCICRISYETLPVDVQIDACAIPNVMNSEIGSIIYKKG